MQTQEKQSSRTEKLLREFKELPFDEQREFYININYLFNKKESGTDLKLSIKDSIQFNNKNLGHLPEDYKFDREELYER